MTATAPARPGVSTTTKLLFMLVAGGAVITDFPYEQNQIAFVAKGRDGVPGFGASLSATQLRQVVEYTRTGLGR